MGLRTHGPSPCRLHVSGKEVPGQAAEAEDYKSAAAQRDALTNLQLQQRRLELQIDGEARTVHYGLGERDASRWQQQMPGRAMLRT